MKLPQSSIEQLNQFGRFLTFTRTPVFNWFLHMTNDFIFLCTGNQYGKTAGTAFQYVLRILGFHPVPKKNLMYFECPKRAEAKKIANETNEPYESPHGYYLRQLTFEDGSKIEVPGWEKGTWSLNDKPEDDKCPYCGEDIIIHERNSKVFRFCSQTLPGEKETIEGTDGASAEVKNAVYPEFKKWLPEFLIKKDITFRSNAMIIKDPWAGHVLLRDEVYKGMDAVVEFVSYSMSVNAVAGTQKCSVWVDEEPPKDFWDEQVPRLLVEDGDIVLSLTPANRMCFDTETEVLTDRGWKLYDEILMSDKLMSYNMDKDLLEWSDILGFNMYEYSGDMTYMRHNHFNALITPEHKWVASNARHHENKKLIQTDALNSKNVIKAMSKNVKNENKSLLKDEFIKLLGWIVSDGTRSSGKICIYQSETAYPEHCAKIDKILSCFPKTQWRKDIYEYTSTNVYGKEWNGYGRCCRWNITHNLRKELLKYLDDKSIRQDFVCSLPKDQLVLLYDAIVDGDGTRNENGRVTLKQVNNEKLIDTFQLICTLLGRLSSKSDMKYEYKNKSLQRVNVFSEGKRYFPNVHYKSLKVDTVEYDGLVWCPSTKNKTVVMRRKGCVSISGNSWTYDGLFERASVYIRSKSICEALSTEDNPLKMGETSDNDFGVGVIQASSYDNPTISNAVIERLMETTDDPDVVLTRIYGVHKAASGRVFKDFDYRIHVIDGDKYFPTGMYHDWRFARMIDYHEKNPWACGWIALSPHNEAFVFQEMNPSPEKLVTREISHKLADLSDDFRYTLDLIDPLANKIQSNTGTTVLEDLNTYFHQYRREGAYPGFQGGYWEAWDTKSTRGRDEVRRRLKWAKQVKKPFNNKVSNQGIDRYVPTLWIFKGCKETAKSLKQWRYEEYGDRQSRVNKDANEKTTQKFSHFCMCLEAIFKDKRFRPPVNRTFTRKTPRYFQGSAA